MQNKLKNNADHFAIEDLKIAYVRTRFVEKILKIIVVRYKIDFFKRYRTIKQIMNDLNRAYADFEKKQTARNEFRNLKQKKISKFSNFLNEISAIDA